MQKPQRLIGTFERAEEANSKIFTKHAQAKANLDGAKPGMKSLDYQSPHARNKSAPPHLTQRAFPDIPAVGA